MEHIKTNIKYQLALTSIWVLAIIIVNPIGDFPLNDDWSYAKPVQSLLNGIGIQFTGWMSMTLFAQVLWGALWCKIFGFSFTVLRFSTLLLSLIGILFTYKLLSKFVSKHQSFLLTTLIAFNPIYFNLSFTFMTDVPFYATSILSIYYFILYLMDKRISHWLMAIMFTIVAILIRQLALAIPLSLLLIGCFKWFKSRKLDYYFFLPFILSFLIFIGYQHLAHEYLGAHGRYEEQNNKLVQQVINAPFGLLISIINRSVIGFVYLALFLSPLLIALFVKAKKIVILASILLGVMLGGLLTYKNYTLPILDNIIYNLGLGPATLYDYWFADLHKPVQISNVFWVLLTFMSSILLIFMMINLLTGLKAKLFEIDQKTMFLLLILAIYIGVICSIYTYDRYYLLPIPLLIAGLGKLTEVKFNTLLFSLLTVIFITFSIIATKDYIAWNNARWRVADYLIQEKDIPVNKIDGGFEFNGWYNYNDVDQPAGRKNLWVHDVDFIITFKALNGTEIVHEESYYSWLWMRNKSIKALKKNDGFRGLKNPYYQ